VILKAEILKVLKKYTEINQQVPEFLLRGTQHWGGITEV
jgi:septum formation topological specificity factor MinE